MSRGKKNPINKSSRNGRNSIARQNPKGINTNHWTILSDDEIKNIRHIVIDDLRSHKDDLDTDDGWLFLRNSQDAIEFFEKHPDLDLETLFWDHDLGQDDTSRRVALLFEERAYFKNPLRVKNIFVHTSNSSGRDWLATSLRQYDNVLKVHSDDVGLIYVGEHLPDFDGGGN